MCTLATNTTIIGNISPLSLLLLQPCCIACVSPSATLPASLVAMLCWCLLWSCASASPPPPPPPWLCVCVCVCVYVCVRACVCVCVCVCIRHAIAHHLPSGDIAPPSSRISSSTTGPGDGEHQLNAELSALAPPPPLLLVSTLVLLLLLLLLLLLPLVSMVTAAIAAASVAVEVVNDVSFIFSSFFFFLNHAIFIKMC